MLLRQCARIVRTGALVEVVEAAITPLIQSMDPKAFEVPDWDGPHAVLDPPEALASWLLAYNAVNFSYWRDDGRRYWTEIDGDPVGADDEALAVMARFAREVRAGRLRDPEELRGIDGDDLAGRLAKAPEAADLPLMEQRAAGLRELGEAYARHGGALEFLSAGSKDAVSLVRHLVRELPSWEDARVLRGERLRFLKRAQLCVAMLVGCSRGRSPFDLGGIGGLTVFSDYRLPQILRGAGVIRLRGDLARRIGSFERIDEGSPEEVELRAATVWAGELVRLALAEERPGITPLQVDYALWRTAVDRADTLPPFHRTRTTSY